MINYIKVKKLIENMKKNILFIKEKEIVKYLKKI